MGAIIFEGNFMVSRQFSGGQFSSGAINLRGNFPGAIIQGAIIQGAIARGQFSNCPDTLISLSE